LEPYIELPPPDPAHKESTAALVAADDAAAVPPALPRTAELLGNSNAPGPVFDPLAGSNVVFVLDNSLGMMTNHKSFYARQELVRALQSMYPARTFYVLLFHSGGYEGMPALGPVAATPENVRDMTNWLFTVGYRNGADPTKAMLRALGLSPAPDQVWLLSGDAFPDTVIDSIREANSAVNARINTVGFHSRDAEAQLRQIAYENRGVYRFVPPPNPPAP
jgi:hypothetical protein